MGRRSRDKNKPKGLKKESPIRWVHEIHCRCPKGHPRNLKFVLERKEPLISIPEECSMCGKHLTFKVKLYIEPIRQAEENE